MDTEIFRRFSRIAYEKAGISLKEGKEPLLAARVGRRVRALGLSSEDEYLELLQEDATGTELVSFLDVVSTNYTRFFRETDHFDALVAAMTRWVRAGREEFRIWSAASSTGEEPYSIAIAVLERFPSVSFKILATDISTRVLTRASAGAYGAEAVDGISLSQRDTYFTRSSGGANAVYTVRPEVRGRVVFRRLNLSSTPFPMSGPFDVIFCRNVMIYFDNTVRQRLTLELERLLQPGGMLAIGHSETLTGIHCGLAREAPSVFTKRCEALAEPGGQGKDARRCGPRRSTLPTTG
jgi:chemotaxis protein methyltransferase CheR